MSDIELVIKIPKEIMEYIKNNGCLSVIYNDEVAKAIINGTPLPKGHGDLIDRNVAYDEFDKACLSWEGGLLEYIPTVIPSDKETENGR